MISILPNISLSRIKAIGLLVIVLGVSTYELSAQQYDITIFNDSDGLPGNQINDLLQDRYGRIWVGTMNGLAIYDGFKFLQPDRKEPVSSNPVRSIFEDEEGFIWIGMGNFGVARFNGTSYEYFDAEDGFTSGSINSMTQDLRNHIWFATSNGVFRYDGKQFHSYNEIRGLSNDYVFDVSCDSEGTIWASTKSGVSKIILPDITNYYARDGLSSDITYNVSEDSQNRIWIGTYLGITLYENGRFRKLKNYPTTSIERIEKIIHTNTDQVYFASYGSGVGEIKNGKLNYLTVKDGLPSNIVKDIIIDKEGNLWFGTWNGLCMYKGDHFITYTEKDGLNNNNLLSIATDEQNRTWFGTLTGGLNYIDQGKIESLRQENGLKSSTIWSILPDIKGYHWFGTTSGPVRLDLATFEFSTPYPELDNMIIYTMHQNSMGFLLFGTDKGIYQIADNMNRFSVLGKTYGLENDKVRYLFEDKDGTLWIGTMNGIYYKSKEDNTIRSFNERYNLPGAPITSIIQDSTGNLIFSTYNFGIFIYNKSNQDSSITILDVKHGLYSDKILFSLIDSYGKLWLGTPTGLDRIDWNKFISNNELIVQHYDKSKGYFGVETNSACIDKENNIWFATVNGAIKNGSDRSNKDISIPILRLTNIELFNDDVDWKKKKIKVDDRTGLPLDLILAYNNNNISFTFQGVYLSQPEETVYEFVLEGFDEAWSPASSQTFANYSNLSAGDYTFKVKASTNQRDWTNPVTYTFSIRPPYWKTPFFYFLYIVAIAGSIFLFFRIRTRSLQRTQAILRQKVEQRTQELNEKNIELEKLSIAASGTDNAVLIFDENKNIEWANTGYTKMTGYTVDLVKIDFGDSISAFTFNIDADEIANNCINEKISTVFESQIPNLDGRMIWTSCTLTPIFHESGKLKKIVLINTDITLRKKMEEQIRESLEEKGLLLKEIHHRVKNNLQIIISLFNLQTHYIEDETSLGALKEGQDRIKSMALIHERFYQSEGLSKIDFDDYIRRLTENLYISFNKSPEKIKLILDTDSISLDIDTAVPCGLIINELVSNALKHAFVGRETGEMRISFKNLNDELIRLTVSDDGVGFPDGFNFEESDSLGIQLMNALTSQLEGKLQLHRGMGSSFVLEFKSVNQQEEKAML